VINEHAYSDFNYSRGVDHMLRSVLGVIVGYIVMFILQVAAFMTIYTMMGPDWSFRPGSYEASVPWTAMQFSVILITAIIAGFICALIARGGKAPLALAGVVLVLGLVLGATSMAMRPADTHEVRTGNVPNMEAMSKARHPSWVIFLGPVIGALGAVIGGKLKRRG
jgi:peptidoglycan biosynthesis protein MviN/MurJ (putative lipid II flippase)